MKPLFLIPIFIISLISCQAQIPNKEGQIAAAIQAAPPEKQEGATVYGFDENGKKVLLREGTNEQICIADDPNKEGFSVACYHKDLHPFMKRGDELRAEGKRPDAIFEIREKEAKSGELKMPTNPTTLHVLSGKEGKYNSESGKVENASLRYVVYIPFATAESTGLPIRPLVPGGAWIMNPGTHRAHIMITPSND
jgi:hypothetical protein